MAFGMAQGMGDFLGSYNKESNLIRQENDKKNSDDAAIEQKALEHLANADDPRIRSAAVTAMLTPKKMGQGGALAKWFGQQTSHPVFDQVHQLINGGGADPTTGQPQEPVQPFMSIEDKTAATSAGTITGRLRGANAGYQEVTGENLPDEDIRRGALGALGAPPSRPQPLQYGTITQADGTTVAGTYDPTSGEYTDSDGNYISGAKSFSRTNSGAAGNPNAGSKWVTQPDGKGGFVQVHVDAHGKPISDAVSTVGPNAPPNQIFQTPTGFQGVAPGRAGGAPPQVIDVQGGNIPTKPEPQSVSFDALQKIAADVEKRAQGSVAHFGGLPPDQKELQAARDREAQTSGFPNYKALQDQINAGQRAISSATQAPPAGIEPAAGGGAGGGAAGGPGSAPRGSTKPAETKPGGKPRAAVPGKLDVNSILAELDKLKDF